MSRQIEKWVAEHRNFGKLLQIIEQQLDVFHRGEHPNYGLMLDVVYYMIHYPDQFHHPKEDEAFKYVVEKDSTAANLIEGLHRQHRAVVDSGKVLRDRLDAVLNGVVLPRSEVVQAARRYIEYLRSNMSQEERTLFPLAQKVLGEADWKSIDARAPNYIDPLFGDSNRERYRALHRQIAGEVDCDCVVA